ncbi:hypothetical protein [Desulfofundulus thermocisternus]|uniref:hypothetical protein n=1 Tax=Desulfofundulus thermocisternus TaxID=42471 RepID=UPI00217D49A6|nr:hypothetical protein [Desulfofundulus thermocisternus]MCS5695258.1 hypothetical protein [Desulfofundulus thermocisternus]
MKYNRIMLFALLILMFSLFSLGCGTESRIKQLSSEANNYVAKGKLDDAISLYNQILQIKEDENIRKQLNEVKYEKYSLEQVKKFREGLYNIQKNKIRDGITVNPTDMEYVFKDLNELVANFDKIDENKNTDIAKYVKEIKESISYQNLKDTLNKGQESFKSAGMDEALGKLDSQYDMLNTIIVASYRNQLNNEIDEILSMSIPSKYE